MRAGYHVKARVQPQANVELAKSDLDVITDINPFRITSVSVILRNAELSVCVRVCSKDFPIMVTDASIVHIVKKRRWGLFGRGNYSNS